jgi:hypothetical protein
LADWLRQYGRNAGFALAAILAGLSFAAPAGLPARWAATAVLILSLTSLVREWYPRAAAALDTRRAGWRQVASRWLPYLAVTAGTLVALSPISLGEMPVSQDHINHYAFTEILVHDMIPSGRLFGWTDRVGIGYPFGDIHYTLCYLVTGLPHLITFGLVDLDTSYAIGICVAWLVSSLAIVALARRLGAGPWGATLVGLINTVDVGSDREGGWTYSMFHGVWPQQLATGVWVLAILALWRLAEKADTRRMALAALLGGLAIWIHPMSSVVLLIAGLLLFAVRLLRRDPDAHPGDPRGTIRLIPALGLSGLIGLIWAARMMTWGDAMWSGHVYWEQLPQLAARALTGSPFDHQLAIVAALALVGVIGAVLSRRTFALLAVLICATLLAIGAMDLVLGSDLGLAGGPFKTLQYRRFSIAIKPFWYALAALGLSFVARGIASAATERLRAATAGIGARILVAVLLTPIVYAAVTALPTVVTSPSLRPLTMSSAGEVEHTAAIRQILEQEAERLGWRVHRAVYYEKPGHGGRYPMQAIADTGFGMLPTVFPPAQNFENIARTTRPETMYSLGATIIVSRWPVRHKLLEEVGRHGAHRVYRFTMPPPAPAEIRGPGRLEIAAWGDEDKVLEVSGARAETSVLLAMTPFGKWRAIQGEQEIPIAATQLGGVLRAELKGIGDGEIRLEYGDSAVENLTFAIGAIALLLCLAGLILRPRPLPGPWPRERLAPVYRGLGYALLVLLAAIVVAAAAGSGAAVDKEWLAGEPRGAGVAAVLHRQGIAGVVHEPARFCVRPHTRDPKWGCSEALLAPRIAPAAVRGGKVPSCLSIGIPPRGKTAVSFDLPSSARVIKGLLHSESGKIDGGISFDNDHSSRPLVASGTKGRRYRVQVPDGATRAYVWFKQNSGKPVRVCAEAVAIDGVER